MRLPCQALTRGLRTPARTLAIVAFLIASCWTSSSAQQRGGDAPGAPTRTRGVDARPGPSPKAKPNAPLRVDPSARGYHVGPGQKYQNIGDVPWYRLEAGDTVYIHYREEPYREKFLISGRGTPSKWIRVLGVPAENGELPVISGDGATTSRNMHYRWQNATGDSAIQWLGVIQIAVRADENFAPLPGYIEIANLRVQDSYGLYRFTAEDGAAAPYSNFAACIYARSAQHLVIRDSVLTNCGQGFYNWTGDGSSDAFWTGLARDIVLRGNYFYVHRDHRKAPAPEGRLSGGSCQAHELDRRCGAESLATPLVSAKDAQGMSFKDAEVFP